MVLLLWFDVLVCYNCCVGLFFLFDGFGVCEVVANTCLCCVFGCVCLCEVGVGSSFDVYGLLFVCCGSYIVVCGCMLHIIWCVLYCGL